MSDENFISGKELYDLLEKIVGLDHSIFKIPHLKWCNSNYMEFSAKYISPILEKHGFVLQRLPGFWAIHVEKEVKE